MDATGNCDDFSVEEWSEILEHHPNLIERPILILNGKAVVGRPTDALAELLRKSGYSTKET